MMNLLLFLIQLQQNQHLPYPQKKSIKRPQNFKIPIFLQIFLKFIERVPQ